jgi:hypothetical protein
MARRHLRRLTPGEPQCERAGVWPMITRCGTALPREGVLLCVLTRTLPQATPLASRRAVAVES